MVRPTAEQIYPPSVYKVLSDQQSATCTPTCPGAGTGSFLSGGGDWGTAGDVGVKGVAGTVGEESLETGIVA